MAVGGPKPKPAAQKRREGNPGRRRIVDPPKLPDGKIRKPEFASPHASAEWDRTVPGLVAAGIAKPVHAGPLEALCELWAIAVDARRMYEQEGLVEEGSMGQMVVSPFVRMYQDAIASYMRLATEFGLTASAAQRLEGLGTGDEDEPFAAIGPSPRLRAVK